MKALTASLLLGSLALTSSPVVAAPSKSCPAKDFDGFLAAFMDSSSVQRDHVMVPLSSTTVDADAQPEPAPVEKMLTADEISYPLLPSKADRAKSRLETTITPASASDTEVKPAQGDAGFQLRYLFRKTPGCWTLVKMSDDSL